MRLESRRSIFGFFFKRQLLRCTTVMNREFENAGICYQCNAPCYLECGKCFCLLRYLEENTIVLILTKAFSNRKHLICLCAMPVKRNILEPMKILMFHRFCLVGCFGLNGPLRQYFSLYQAVSQREGERKEK